MQTKSPLYNRLYINPSYRGFLLHIIQMCLCIIYKYDFRTSTLSSFSHGRSRSVLPK